MSEWVNVAYSVKARLEKQYTSTVQESGQGSISQLVRVSKTSKQQLVSVNTAMWT